MKIICDRCIAEIRPEIKLAEDGDIHHAYYLCPECGASYHLCATDTALRRDVERYTRRAEKVKQGKVTEEFLRETAALKEQNTRRCRELMEQHPLALFLQPDKASVAE